MGKEDVGRIGPRRSLALQSPALLLREPGPGPLRCDSLSLNLDKQRVVEISISV